MSDSTPPEKKKNAPRQAMPEQPPAERRRNFDEVELGYTPAMAQLEAARCLHCKHPKCMLGCPVRVHIPEFVRLIAAGDFVGAARKIKEDNALPAVTGRVCPQEDQCEKHCVIGLKGEPLAIGKLERFAADYARERAAPEKYAPPPPTGKKVAIIGAGPAGLTAAGDLAKMGHAVTVFEALHKPGGVLFYGIPEFRLPKKTVEAEIECLRALGVAIKLDQVIGKIKTIGELMRVDGFDAVFIGTGAGLPYFLNIPGENLNGVYSANEFLTRVNLMRAWHYPDCDTPLHRHQKVAVIGGGNTAIDSARTALRLPGNARTTIVYRRAREDLPARREEIAHAAEEGIEFSFLTAPTRIIGDAAGWVSGLECVRMRSGEPDASGRRAAAPIPDSGFVMAADAVIIAIGSGSNPLLTASGELKTGPRGHIEVADPDTLQTARAGVFAGGDIVTGAATVIQAMGAGKKAALGIHHYLMDKTG